jgi:hypothetical protein
MTTTETGNQSKDRLIMSAEEWLGFDFRIEESQLLIGTGNNAIVRPGTKNTIEAQEKAYKTTFLLRLALGLATGQTLFPSLPVSRPLRVLYLHGELAPAELKERLQTATQGLNRPLEQFYQGRSLTASLVTDEGRAAIIQLVQEFKPDVLVIDPWQSFIAGADENSFKEISAATKFLDQLIVVSGLTVFIAVHLGKNKKRGARGHSSFGGWRDTKFTLTRSGMGLNVVVEPRWGKAMELNLNFKAGTLWEGNAPGWTKQAEQIRKLVEVNKGALSRAQLAFGLGLEPNGSALRMALQRAQGGEAIDVDGDTITLHSSTPASPNHPLLEGGGICDGNTENQL